ncbi:sensor histidine kinase [Streptosporangium sp. NPDC051022]|uniref:sensor histidine kinase n=1 Tax=Streptosporangium sp. NPDC051022 TaxID=3155752 RepID=UPI00343726F4
MSRAFAPAGTAVLPTLRFARVRAVAPWVIACFMFAMNVGMLATVYDAPVELTVLLAAACAAPVTICGHRPVTAWLMIYIGMLVTPPLVSPPSANNPWPWLPMPVVAYLIVLFVLAQHRPRWMLAAVWALSLLGALVDVSVVPVSSTNPAVVLQLVAAVVPVPLIVGDNLRWRRLAQARVAEQEQVGAAERARRELLEERTRIAREMHDVVAHHMSVIAVQASSAARRLGVVPADVEREFDSIGAAARQSLAEMRRLLGVLRSDDAMPQRAPLPGLDQVGALVESARRAGTPVELTVTGLPAHVQPGIELPVYRIVQEALSNVIRHAPGAATAVAVTGNGTGLRVVVENAPPAGVGHALAEPAGTGHGLAGMRERAATVGGVLLTGPTPRGGFRVELTLPLVRAEHEEEDA